MLWIQRLSIVSEPRAKNCAHRFRADRYNPMLLEGQCPGIVNLSDLGEKEPHTLGHADFNSLVISSQML